MSGNNILLDTNIVIEIFNGNKLYADKLSQVPVLYLPSIVLGELYIGVNRVTNKAKHLKKIIDFLELCTVVGVDSKTAEHYGQIVASLYKKGKPIPMNDVWIAAIAIQHNLALISQDNHFKYIPNLKLKKW